MSNIKTSPFRRINVILLIKISISNEKISTTFFAMYETDFYFFFIRRNLFSLSLSLPVVKTRVDPLH